MLLAHTLDGFHLNQRFRKMVRWRFELEGVFHAFIALVPLLTFPCKILILLSGKHGQRSAPSASAEIGAGSILTPAWIIAFSIIPISAFMSKITWVSLAMSDDDSSLAGLGS